MIGRRGFLKTIGAAALAVVAAPLYIPAERLDFGVPTQKLVTPVPAKLYMPSSEWEHRQGTAKILRAGTVSTGPLGINVNGWSFGEWNGEAGPAIALPRDDSEEMVIAGYRVSELQEIARQNAVAVSNTRILQEAMDKGGIINIEALGLQRDRNGMYAVNSIYVRQSRVDTEDEV